MSIASLNPLPIMWKGADPMPSRATAAVSVSFEWERWWVARENELKSIRRYRDDWDGLGAKAPDPTLIDTAIEFLLALKRRDRSQPPFRVALSPDSTVFFEWQGGGAYAEVEIVAHDRAEWVITQPQQRPEYLVEPLELTLRSKNRDDDWPQDQQITSDVAGSSVVLL